MSFRRSERLVTAFLCVSGAAESCVLPFLCLHLTQLGVSPARAGLAICSLLLLRGVGGALWWRALRSDRRPTRRRLAAVAGAILSATVIAALAALPPSIGCDGGAGVDIVQPPSPPPPLPHEPGPPVPALQGTGSAPGHSWMSPPGQVAEGSHPASTGSGSQRPPPAGVIGGVGGGGSEGLPPPANSGSPTSSGSGDPQPEAGSDNNHRPVSSGNGDQWPPETSQTSEHNRPETNEPQTSDTSENNRPETSDTSDTNRTESSDSSWQQRPSETEQNTNQRPSTSETDADQLEQTVTDAQDKTEQSETNDQDETEETETNKQTRPLTPPEPAAPGPDVAGVNSHDSHQTTITTATLYPHHHHPPPPAPPPTLPSVGTTQPPQPRPVVGSSDETGGEISGMPICPPATPAGGGPPNQHGANHAGSAVHRPPAPPGEDGQGGERLGPGHATLPGTETGTEGEEESGEVTRPSAQLSKPQSHVRPVSPEREQSDSHTSPGSIATGGSQPGTSDLQTGPQTTDHGDEGSSQNIHHHASAQTHEDHRPAPPSGHQTSDDLSSDYMEEYDVDVRRTTRSPPPLQSEEVDEDQLESESAESDLSSQNTEEPVDVGRSDRVNADVFENPSPPSAPTSGHSRDSPLAGKEQERPDATNDHAPISQSHSYSGGQSEDRHPGRQQPHHRKHNNRQHSSGDKTIAVEVPKLPDFTEVPSHEDKRPPGQDVDEQHRESSHHQPSAGSSRSESGNSAPAQRPSIVAPTGERDGSPPCIELSQVEIPWDPRKHPGGLTICDPPALTPPARPGRGEGHRSGHPRALGTPSDYPRAFPVQRHEAPGTRDLADLATREGPSEPAVGRDQGKSRHRSAGWRRVPVWAGDKLTADHPYVERMPPTNPPPPQPRQQSPMRAREAAAGERDRSYNSIEVPEDVQFSDVILRPQDMLPLMPIPGQRMQEGPGSSQDRSGNEREWERRVDSEVGRQREDTAENEDRSEGQRRDRNDNRDRLPSPADESRQRIGGQILLPQYQEPAIPSPPILVVNLNAREPEEGTEDAGNAPISPGRYEQRTDDINESRSSYLPAMTSADAGSRDRYDASAAGNAQQSRDRGPEVWHSAEPASRDPPRSVDPSGWSRRGSPEEDDAPPEQRTGAYETERGNGGSVAPTNSRYELRQRQQNGRKPPRRNEHPASRRHPSGGSRYYNLPPQPTDGGPTVDPTGGWSLTGALHQLEDLSPTLTRLLSGGKRRRETRGRLSRSERQRRERGRRRHGRRQKRSVSDVLTGWVDFGKQQRTRRGHVRRRNGWEAEDEESEQQTNSRMSHNEEEYNDGSVAIPHQQPKRPAASHWSRATSYDTSRLRETSPELSRSQPRALSRPDRGLPPQSAKGPSAESAEGAAAEETAESVDWSAPLDADILFLISLALLSVWGIAGAPYRRLVQRCWRHALDEAEHLERTDRPRPAAEAAAAALLAVAAGLWPLVPACLPAGRRPLVVMFALAGALTLLAAVLLPWIPLVVGKEPPQRTTAVLRALVSTRSSLLFTGAVFLTGLLASAEFHFLFPLTATWRPAPQALLLLAAAAALASRLPVRALYRPLMVRCGFVGSVVLSFTALSARCLCYVIVPSAWGLVTAQLLSGLTETLFWRAAHVFADKTAHHGRHEATLSVLEALYASGRCCGVVLAGAAFSAVGGQATFAALATLASAAALGYYVAARLSGDTPDLAYAKLPSDDDRDETEALTGGSWSRDQDDPDEVTAAPPGASADQDWLERAMRQEGLL